MNPVSRNHPLNHYTWGQGAEAWNLVDSPGLSVKLESMPAGSEEELHYHRDSRQFFFILKGEAVFELEGRKFHLREQEGIQVSPGMKHRIMNQSGGNLDFILCSQPSAAGDRYKQE